MDVTEQWALTGSCDLHYLDARGRQSAVLPLLIAPARPRLRTIIASS